MKSGRSAASADEGSEVAALVFENDRARAGAEFERALDLNPKHVMARCWHALLFLQWACGKYELGITEARRALDLDPLSSYAAIILAACLCTARPFG